MGSRVLRALAAMIGIVAVVAGVRAVVAPAVSEAPTTDLLSAPEPGQVDAGYLHAGLPVFVVRHRDGGVSVLSAINPHLDILVVWCAPERVFVEPGPASRFDESGRYLGGPAPVGLRPFEAQLIERGGQAWVLVGPAGEPPHRAEEPQPPQAEPSCAETEGFDGGLAHDLPERSVSPAMIPWPERGRFVAVRGTVHHTAQGMRLCDASRAATCPSDAVPVAGPFGDWWPESHPLRGWERGVFLVRIAAPGRLDRLARVQRVVELVDEPYRFTYLIDSDVEYVQEPECRGADVRFSALLVAVEDTSEGAMAVLAEPAGDRRGTQAPMDRFVLHEQVQYLIWSDPHPLAFREEVEALLAASAPIEVELHVDGCGRITLLSLDPMAM